jgi:hypothetical protein
MQTERGLNFSMVQYVPFCVQRLKPSDSSSIYFQHNISPQMQQLVPVDMTMIQRFIGLIKELNCDRLNGNHD